MAQQTTPVTGVRIPAHKVQVGMTVTIKGETGTWSVLNRHPKPGYWWVHRWTDKEEWQTAAAHYRSMEQVIDNG